MAKLISGKEVSTQIRQKIREQAQQLREDRGIQPGLAVILVGNDPASQIYVRNKQRACEEVGFHAFEYKLNENATEEQLLDLIGVLNKDNKVHGILVQMPLPDHLDEQLVIKTISPLKDVSRCIKLVQRFPVYRAGSHAACSVRNFLRIRHYAERVHMI